ncbi:MAG: SH3 domain-containing protein [Tissierellia bacterium]|nr:SH3 domain-containing protein [Tissierellia bacterium]
MKRLWAIIITILLFFTSCEKVQFIDSDGEEDNKNEVVLLETPEGSQETQLIGGEEEYDEDNEYMVEVESLNLRKTPDTDGEIITTLEEGEILRIIETKGPWAKVEVEDFKGYVAKKYLKELERTPSMVDEDSLSDYDDDEEPYDEDHREENRPPSEKTMVCDVDVLNIRTFASENAEIRGTLERGDVVEIIMDTDLTRNQWVKIQFGELSGYVVKEYLK